MASPVFIASILTILPAMGAMWYFLNRYEGYFEDARVFISLVFGFFAGLVASAFEVFAFGFGTAEFEAAAGVATAFIFYVAGYGFFETGIKAAVLGLKQYRHRKDTPYYGVAFGLGFGAILAMMTIAVNISNVGGLHNYDMGPFLAMVMLPLGGIFVHGAIGAWVGQGVVDGKLWKGWGMGTLLAMPLLGSAWLSLPTAGTNTANWFPAWFAILYGASLLMIAQVRLLDHVVPPEVADQVRRAKRREARRQDKER
ncbi:MAG: hypothetical protein ACPHK8_01890 [Thermoplasmatota archaeon]